MSLSTHKRGASAELLACAALVDAGFEVFRNVTPDGPIDIVVWDGETFYPIDVKRASHYINQQGKATLKLPSKNNDHALILCLTDTDEWVWVNEAPDHLWL